MKTPMFGELLKFPEHFKSLSFSFGANAHFKFFASEKLKMGVRSIKNYFSARF